MTGSVHSSNRTIDRPTHVALTSSFWLQSSSILSTLALSPAFYTAAMKSTLMGSLKFQFPPLKICQIPQKLHFQASIITCSLRGGPRKPLWRSKRLSTEAIQAIQSLKLAKSSTLRLEEVFNSKLSRLLKADLLDTLDVLQNQNELDLALKVLSATLFF